MDREIYIKAFQEELEKMAKRFVIKRKVRKIRKKNIDVPSVVLPQYSKGKYTSKMRKKFSKLLIRRLLNKLLIIARGNR